MTETPQETTDDTTDERHAPEAGGYERPDPSDEAAWYDGI